MADERVVLAIDTSTVVNVGLARGTDVLATATVEDRMAHVEQLTPLIRDCLAQAGLRLAEVDQIVVGLGPGPFTGLRVGIVTAQTLAAVGGLDLHGICSLDVLAGASTRTRPRRSSWWPPTPGGGRSTGPRTPPTAAGKGRLRSDRRSRCRAGPRSGLPPRSIPTS